MEQYERSIQVAFDKLSGKIVEADKIFETTKDAFLVRKQFHKNEVELYCCECDQKLNVSNSKYDRLHFKHQPKADFCILKDGDLTFEQLEQFNKILIAKESPRHHELKNKIAQRISKVEGVDVSSIAIDNKFIIRENEKRRPDVYCKYRDKEIVFEIQLSDLSLRYILNRYEFYKKHGIYLIWILDNFDIHRQAQLEKDIKYLTKYENFFKLDENTESFFLECKYKFPFLTDDNRLLTKWLDKSVTLNQVTFDSESYQIYYYNFGDNRSKVEENRKLKVKQKIQAEAKWFAEQRLEEATYKANNIIQEIRDLRKRQSLNFDSAVQLISELDEQELDVFNSKLNFRNRSKGKKPVLHQWISSAAKADFAFIEFIISCKGIDLDVNEKDADERTVLQELYNNTSLSKRNLVKCLFKHGYNLTSEDEMYFHSLINNDTTLKNDWALFKIYDKLSNRDLVYLAGSHSILLLIIESAKKKEIIGFNYKPDEWIAFANNAIQNHSEYWNYIEIAFKHYKLWDLLIQLDKKGTFQKKVKALYLKMPDQKFDFDNVFRDLYPELTM